MGAVAQALGPLPEWLVLGPVTQVDGRLVREILNDWKGRKDSPPRYIAEGEETRRRNPIDRSETRPDVEVQYPGKSIKELKGIHSGKVAILFNGQSMGNLDLQKITVPTIGMNRTHIGWPTYKGPQPDYLCIVDHDWFNKPEWRTHVLKHPKIINGSTHKSDIGYRVARSGRMAPFSFDLGRDGYVYPIPCTTGHLALQLAVYLGFTELHCIGWDLKGKHFDGSHGSKSYGRAFAYHKRQVKALTEAGIKVYLCESPDSKLKNLFEHSSFEAVCG